jgi:hypothetical protein
MSPTCLWKISFPWPRRRSHATLPYQRHCFTISYPDYRHYETNITTNGLHCHTGRCHHHIPPQQHEIGCPQGRKLFIRNQSTQSCQRTFLPTFRCRHSTQNGAILNIAHIIKHIMASATEAELAALYIVARKAVYIRIILDEMGHKQPATPLQTDNSMAEVVVNGKIQPKRTKAMDMRFHWLRDRECQEQFRIHWHPGKLNYAHYWI